MHWLRICKTAKPRFRTSVIEQFHQQTHLWGCLFGINRPTTTTKHTTCTLPTYHHRFFHITVYTQIEYIPGGSSPHNHRTINTTICTVLLLYSVLGLELRQGSHIMRPTAVRRRRETQHRQQFTVHNGIYKKVPPAPSIPNNHIVQQHNVISSTLTQHEHSKRQTVTTGSDVSRHRSTHRPYLFGYRIEGDPSRCLAKQPRGRSPDYSAWQSPSRTHRHKRQSYRDAKQAKHCDRGQLRARVGEPRGDTERSQDLMYD